MVTGRAFRKRAAGAALGLLADRLLGEPPAELHPVARFGAVMQRMERARYADSRSAGVTYAAAGLAIGITGGALLRTPARAVTLTASGRELRAAAAEVQDALFDADLDRARNLVPALVGRDPSKLDSSGLAAAVIESLGENTVDAVVAPALWAVAGGAVGTAAYRAVNTMDAMVGNRSSRYEQFGWASARLDDVANLIPARVTALLVAAVRPRAAAEIWRAVREQAPAHPSPNSGVAEAAFAAALGVELGGKLRYGDRVEDRPLLGFGPRPQADDIQRAITLASQVELALVAALGLFALSGRRRK
jgi:adenosylcobinamide-phosphate synthase